MMGHVHSDITKQKLSMLKKGDKNPQFGKVRTMKGKYGKNHPAFGKRRPGTGRYGKDNHQFGKSPSHKAGKGIYGKFNNCHFRSSLELFYLIYWYENNINVINAETKEFRVTYLTEDNLKHTYSPDFYLPELNILVELKPEKLHTNILILIKFSALQQHHIDKKCELWGINNIGDFVTNTILTNKIEQYLNNNLLIIPDIQYNRLRKNYADIIRTII